MERREFLIGCCLYRKEPIKPTNIMKEFMLIASLVLSFCILILCRDYIVFMLKK
ncbi:hypothetical protein M086_3697 [Bacteroides fragilis str. S13 L11]|nr:hypothetical protein M077_4433 [Bacteroides fragilis str. 2-F-2 \